MLLQTLTPPFPKHLSHSPAPPTHTQSSHHSRRHPRSSHFPHFSHLPPHLVLHEVVDVARGDGRAVHQWSDVHAAAAESFNEGRDGWQHLRAEAAGLMLGGKGGEEDAESWVMTSSAVPSFDGWQHGVAAPEG